MIKIVKNENTKGTLDLFQENGDPIKNVLSVDLSIKPGHPTKATLDVLVSEIEIFCEEEMIYIDIHGNKYKKVD